MPNASSSPTCAVARAMSQQQQRQQQQQTTAARAVVPPLCEGWLEKYSIGRSVFAQKGWHRRYARLTHDGFCYSRTADCESDDDDDNKDGSGQQQQQQKSQQPYKHHHNSSSSCATTTSLSACNVDSAVVKSSVMDTLGSNIRCVVDDAASLCRRRPRAHIRERTHASACLPHLCTSSPTSSAATATQQQQSSSSSTRRRRARGRLTVRQHHNVVAFRRSDYGSDDGGFSALFVSAHEHRKQQQLLRPVYLLRDVRATLHPGLHNVMNDAVLTSDDAEEDDNDDDNNNDDNDNDNDADDNDAGDDDDDTERRQRGRSRANGVTDSSASNDHNDTIATARAASGGGGGDGGGETVMQYSPLRDHVVPSTTTATLAKTMHAVAPLANDNDNGNNNNNNENENEMSNNGSSASMFVTAVTAASDTDAVATATATATAAMTTTTLARRRRPRPLDVPSMLDVVAHTRARQQVHFRCDCCVCRGRCVGRTHHRQHHHTPCSCRATTTTTTTSNSGHHCCCCNDAHDNNSNNNDNNSTYYYYFALSFEQRSQRHLLLLRTPCAWAYVLWTTCLSLHVHEGSVCTAVPTCHPLSAGHAHYKDAHLRRLVRAHMARAAMATRAVTRQPLPPPQQQAPPPSTTTTTTSARTRVVTDAASPGATHARRRVPYNVSVQTDANASTLARREAASNNSAARTRAAAAATAAATTSPAAAAAAAAAATTPLTAMKMLRASCAQPMRSSSSSLLLSSLLPNLVVYDDPDKCASAQYAAVRARCMAWDEGEQERVVCAAVRWLLQKQKQYQQATPHGFCQPPLQQPRPQQQHDDKSNVSRHRRPRSRRVGACTAAYASSHPQRRRAGTPPWLRDAASPVSLRLSALSPHTCASAVVHAMSPLQLDICSGSTPHIAALATRTTTMTTTPMTAAAAAAAVAATTAAVVGVTTRADLAQAATATLRGEVVACVAHDKLTHTCL